MCGFVPWLIRWSERQPLNREEGMATNHGITLNTQPWGNTHADIQSNTHRRTQEQAMNNRRVQCMWYTLLRIGIKHTLWCDVEPPAGVQPQQHHTNMTSSLFLRNNYWRLFFTHRREISVCRLIFFCFDTDRVLTCCSKEHSSVYLGIREGVLEKRWQPWQQCEEGASGAQVCNNYGAEIQTRAFRMH